MASLSTSAAQLRGHFFAGVREDRPAFAASLMVSALCLLGLQDSLVKLASSEVSLWQFQALRSSCNLALSLLLSRILWGTARISPKRPWVVAMRSLFMVGAMLFFFSAIPYLSLSEIAAGLYVYPLFATVLSVVILREKVGPRRIAAVLAGFTGTLLILKPGTEAFHWVSLMPVGAGLCYAAAVLTTRKLCREESPLTLAFGVSLAFVCTGFLGLAVMTAINPTQLAEHWPYVFTGWHPLALWVGGVIVACSLLNLSANIGLTKAYQSAETSWLAPFDYSYLIFMTFWGFVMWGSIPDVLTFAGMALIASSGCYIAWRERRDKQFPPTNEGRTPPPGRRPTRLEYWSLPPY